MTHGIYKALLEAKTKNAKKLAVLLDPDKLDMHRLEAVLAPAIEAQVDYFFIGGSLVVHQQLDDLLTRVRVHCDIPLILFPGSSFQLSDRANALLLLSLISGRNPELLIGQHVIAAPWLKASPLEIISTGYILVESGVSTSVQYMSNTQPVPASKNDIAVCTAIAGEMLGLKTIYLEAGSGAKNAVPESMIADVSAAISVPLLVGGGIRTPEKAAAVFRAGADLLVVGTAFERKPALIREIAATRNVFTSV